MTKKKSKEVAIGTSAYENWRRADEGIPSTFASEFPLYTDAFNVVDEVTEGLGPYQLLNGLPEPFFPGISPSVVLRLENHLNYSDWIQSNDTYKTDTERYHGGLIQEEIAALLSLCLGIRLKAGGENRHFDPYGDPRGHPIALEMSQNPYLRRAIQSRYILPRVREQVNLKESRLLQTLPKLKPVDEIALMRAARLYQEAIWIAEFEPERSWIMMVSAIEVAANRWRSTSYTPLELLRSSGSKNLERILSKSGGNSLVLIVAEYFAQSTGLTAKFKDFIIEFLPEPPTDRPPDCARVQWENKNIMKKSMGVIYDYRSKALHYGIPFPAPMCESPKQWDQGYSERPIGLATTMRSATWTSKETPMLLHTFEYIVRKCLLKWWQMLATKGIIKSS